MPKGDNLRGKRPINTAKGPSSQASIEIRITEVGKLLIQGYQRFEIIAVIKDKYSVSSQQIDRYISRATERIREENIESLEIETKIIEARLLDIYQGARKENNRSAALKAIRLHMTLKCIGVDSKDEKSERERWEASIEEGTKELRKYLQLKDSKKALLT